MKKIWLLTGLLAINLWAAENHASDPVVDPVNEPAVTESTAKAEARSEARAGSKGSEINLDQGAMTEGVDIPTAEILDAGTYALNFRLYSQGGLVSRILFAPLRRIQLGMSLDSQQLIGGGDPHIIRPSVYAKIRAFDGTDVLPALAIGYENEGYLYRRPQKEFLQDSRGAYVVGSHEILLPDLEIHLGVNVTDFDHKGKVFGFAGTTYRLTPSFALLTEYDNIRNGPENRLNVGGRFWVSSFFTIDVAARNVGRNTDRGAERVIKLNYVGQFPFMR